MSLKFLSQRVFDRPVAASIPFPLHCFQKKANLVVIQNVLISVQVLNVIASILQSFASYSGDIYLSPGGSR